MNTILLIALMALTTYLVRMIPFTMFRKKVTSPFLKSLLYYMPDAILSAMTFPSILYTTGDKASAIAGLLIGLLLGMMERSLVEISLATSITALIVWYFF